MAGVVVSNFGRATLASPPSGTGGLSFSVAAGKGVLFPNPAGGEYFYGVLTNAAKSAYEIVKVDSRSTDSFTINAAGRGFEGTTPNTWLAGDIFYAPWTKGMLEEVPFSVAVKALAALSGSLGADKLAYYTSGSAAALAAFTAYARTLMDDADAPTARSTLDVYSRGEIAGLGLNPLLYL